MGGSESQSNEKCVPADCWTPEAPRPARGEGIPVPTRKQKRNRAKVGSDGNVNAICWGTVHRFNRNAAESEIGKKTGDRCVISISNAPESSTYHGVDRLINASAHFIGFSFIGEPMIPTNQKQVGHNIYETK